MKNQITLLFLLFSISMFGQTELNLDWERVTDIPGKALAITMSGDTLYAYTKTSIFYSLDLGETWELGCRDVDVKHEIQAYSKSNVIYDNYPLQNFNIYFTEEGRHLQANYRSTISNGCNTDIFSVSISNLSSFGNRGGHTRRDTLINSYQNFKYLPDGSLIYSKINSRIKDEGTSGSYSFSFYEFGDEDFYWVKNHETKITTIRTADITRFVDYPYQDISIDSTKEVEAYPFIKYIIGYKDSKFIALSPKFYVEMTEDFKIIKKNPLPKTYNNFESNQATFSQIDGVVTYHYGRNIYVTKDSGTSWDIIEFPYKTDVRSLKLVDDIYLVTLNDDLLYGTDVYNLKKFVKFENDSYGPDNIFAFGDTLLAPSTNAYYSYRSFDKGETWEQIVPKGIIADEISNLFTRLDKTYVQASNCIYEHQDNGSFIKTEFQPVRVSYTNSNIPYRDQDAPFYILDNGDIYQSIGIYPRATKMKFLLKYNDNTNRWDTVNQNIIEKAILDNQKFYLLSTQKDLTKKLLVIDSTNIIRNISFPPYESLEFSLKNINNFIVKNDTILLTTYKYINSEKNKMEQFVSIDDGISWMKLKEIPDLLYLGVAISYIRNGKIYFVKDKIWEYSKFDEEPVIVDSLPPIIKDTTSTNMKNYIFNVPFLNRKKTTKTWGVLHYSNIYSQAIIEDTSNNVFISSLTQGLWKSKIIECDGDYVGDSCDDGNEETINDKISKDCSCKGILKKEFCRANDSLALAKIFFDMNGKHWKIHTNWLTDKPLYEWYGITTNDDGCVICIDLDGIDDCHYSKDSNGNNLSGYLSLGIGELDHLQQLHLSNNNISGSITDKIIGNELKNISIAANKIDALDFANETNGIIDLNVNHNRISSINLGIKNLASLDLSSNLISSPISKIELTDKLEYLDISNNNFMGQINIRGINLKYIDCSENELDSIEIDTNLSKLEYLDVSQNQIFASIPANLGLISSLQTLRLSDNKFKECFPDELLVLCDKNVDFTNNPELPWEGDFTRFCNGEDQVGAFCKDLDPLAKGGKIQEDCACIGIPKYSCRVADSLALAAIYEAFDGDNWTNNTNWLTDAPLNEWFGVIAGIDDCVKEINLPSNNLFGVLPSEIGQLDSLEYFNFKNNSIYGRLPNILSNLPNIKGFHLANNNIEDCFPSVDNYYPNQQLAVLDNFTFYNNPKMPWLGDIRPLLIVGHSPIGANCDDGIDSTTYDRIDGSCNCVGKTSEAFCRDRDSSLVADIYKYTNGDHWKHKDNWLSNKPLGSWYGITTNAEGCVISIDLDGVDDQKWTKNGGGNNLFGEIARSIVGLKNLKDLHLSYNNIKKINKEGLPNIWKLEKLSITDNRSPLKWAMNWNVNYLNIANTPAPNVANYIGHISSIEYINIENTGAKSIDNKLYNNHFLKYLNISHNHLTGNLELYENFDNLSSLYLNDNDFSGCFPEKFSKYCSLEFSTNPENEGYNFTGNKEMPWKGDFTNFCNGESQVGAPCDNGNTDDGENDTINEDCDCKKKEMIRTDSMALVAFYIATNGDHWTNNTNWLTSEPISTWFGITFTNHKRVLSIVLPNNNLDGVITPEIDQLTYLNDLTLNNNLLKGEIIQPIFSLHRLKKIDFGNNQFTGSISGYFDALKNLETLILSNNQFSGTIPQTFSYLPYLKYVDISHNQLDGSLQYFTNMLQLEKLDVSFNNFNDVLPNFINISANSIIDLSHNNLKGCFPIAYNDSVAISVINSSNNPLLPWEGVMSNFKDHDQIGAPCDDGNPETLVDAIDIDCNCSEKIVGTKNLESLSLFKIDPNPNNGQFDLKIVFLSQMQFQVKIYSPLGNEIYLNDFKAQRINESIHMPQLSSGLYFVELMTDKGSMVRKIIIE